MYKTRELIMRGIIVVVILVLIVFSIPITTFAYQTNGHYVCYSTPMTPSVLFGTLSVQHMREAVEKWNEVIDYNWSIDVERKDRHSTTNYWSNEDENKIYKKNVGQTYVAQTHYYANTAGRLEEVDIN
jgi:hypothetical protein